MRSVIPGLNQRRFEPLSSTEPNTGFEPTLAREPHEPVRSGRAALTFPQPVMRPLGEAGEQVDGRDQPTNQVSAKKTPR